jgi:hypothetical protein
LVLTGESREETMPPVISDDDCLRFAQCYLEAPVGRRGVFRVADIPVPPGEPEQWAFHILERRDASHLQALAIGSIECHDATVVDGMKSALVPQSGEREPVPRTVAVFAETGSLSPFVSMSRGEDLGDEDVDAARNLAREALTEFHQLLTGSEPKTVPLICLDPELATPAERRRLLGEGTPYAIKVPPEHCFSYPTWGPEDPFDAFDHTTAESIILAHRRDADPAKPTFVRIRDLQGRNMTSAMFEEYLFRFPGEEPEYFVARPALPASASPIELMESANHLARKAWSHAQSSPGRALRLHEFQHPHEERYRQVVSIVARARDLDPDLGKDPGIAPLGG